MLIMREELYFPLDDETSALGRHSDYISVRYFEDTETDKLLIVLIDWDTGEEIFTQQVSIPKALHRDRKVVFGATAALVNVVFDRDTPIE